MKRFTRTTSAIFIFLLSAVLMTPAARAEVEITFRKVADTNTEIPEGTGNFRFFNNPSISGKNVAFFGRDDDDQGGIYKEVAGHFGRKTLKRVANTNTEIPEGTGNFTVFGESPSISGKNVVFSGSGNGGQGGIYKEVADFFETDLRVVADKSTEIPEGTEDFTILSNPSISGKNVAFFGGGDSGQRGIYKEATDFFGTDLRVVADKNTEIPEGTGDFTNFLFASISGKNVAFRGLGSGDQRGVYQEVKDFFGTKLRVVADANTPIPEGDGNFNAFSNRPSISGKNVAFRGLGSNLQSGIYKEVTDFYGRRTLQRVADRNTLVPEGTGDFIGFSDRPSISGKNVAFRGLGGDFKGGIYTDIGGELIKVIAEGDELDGKMVLAIEFSTDGLSGNRIAFSVRLGDGSQAIYVATVKVKKKRRF